MYKMGRNDPCPCGSGRKYKQCCLKAQEAEAPEDLHWRRVRRAIEPMAKMLLDFGAQRYGHAMLEEAWNSFRGVGGGEPFPPDTPHMQVFMPWLFFHWLPDAGKTRVSPASADGLTLGQACLRERQRRLDPLLAAYIKSSCITPFSFYDVVSVRPGRSLLARDIFHGVDTEVAERSGTLYMQVGDILFGKIARVERVCLLEGLSPTCIPPSRKGPILALRRRIEEGNLPITDDTLRQWAPELLGTYRELVEPLLNPQMPELQNTDGDPLVLHKIVYDIDSPEEAFEALADLCITARREELLDESERDDDGRVTRIEFSWEKRGNAKHKSRDNTVMGNITIDGKRLTVEVNSENRARQFEAIMGLRLPAARHGGATTQSSDALLAQARQERAKAPAQQPVVQEDDFNSRPEVQAALAKQLREFRLAWLDTEIPVLGNQTPREAVKTRDGREMVEGLLLEIERSSRKAGQPLEEASLREMRESLGLPMQPRA